MSKVTTESGFTIIEVIVTLAVVSLFLNFFFQMYLTMEAQRIAVARQALASDIASSNLHKFSSRDSLSTLTCNPTTMDLTDNPAAKTGELIGSQADSSTPNAYGFQAESADTTKQLGGNVTQTVRAFAPKGCETTTYSETPIKIESTVTYGTEGRVTHAGYLN